MIVAVSCGCCSSRRLRVSVTWLMLKLSPVLQSVAVWCQSLFGFFHRCHRRWILRTVPSCTTSLQALYVSWRASWARPTPTSLLRWFSLTSQTHTHSRFMSLCPGLLLTPETCGSLSSFWILWGVEKITEASVPTVRLDVTPSGPLMPPRPSSPSFMPDSLPSATLPIYPGLGQAPICWIAYLKAWFFLLCHLIFNCCCQFSCQFIHSVVRWWRGYLSGAKCIWSIWCHCHSLSLASVKSVTHIVTTEHVHLDESRPCVMDNLTHVDIFFSTQW